MAYARTRPAGRAVRFSGEGLPDHREDPLVELTGLFTNHGLTAPALDFWVSDRVRAGSTCRAEILAAIHRLDGSGPPRWHSRDEVIAEVLRVTRRYPSGTVRRILLYDLVGRSTSNHVASGEVERRGNEFRLR